MSWTELKDSLIGSFPLGTELLWDWEGAPGHEVEAIARTVSDGIVAPVEALAIEVNPSTAIENLGRWERDLGIYDAAATVAARRAVLISRFRELGRTVTRPMVQSVLAPLLDVPNAGDVVVVESDRQALRDLHTYRWNGSQVFDTSSFSLKIHVTDDARVSAAGAQLDLLLIIDDLSALVVTLTSPPNSMGATRVLTQGAGTIGRGPLPPATGSSRVRLYFPAMAGAPAGGVMGGDWSVSLRLASGTGTIFEAALFVEGIGRDAAVGGDGRGGGAVYRWGVVAEDAKLGPAANLVAARAALQRITYACRPAALLRRSVGAGALPAGHFGAVAGDPNAVAGASLPGS